MPTVSRGLPKTPHLDIPKREARALLKEWRAGLPEAVERVTRRHPRFANVVPAALAGRKFLLNDAQWVVAREYGFASWAQLKERIDGNTVARVLLDAIHKDDCESVVRILQAHPNLLHVPLWSGNWGPPMSHAANLGKLEIIKAIAALGARDHDHALGRAVLQSKLETARWLFSNGGKLGPGAVMGPCETLSVAGLNLLDELGAPFEDEKGNRLAPLALTLETYGRNPAGKHAVLELFARKGYVLPKTPIMALHCGDLARLKEFLACDPELIHRTFRLSDIYPPELGCGEGGRSGMHWTPIDGTTLLHIAIDFDELEIFELLLDRGADVNARAAVDTDGFGGHTPIYNAVVSHGQRQAVMARRLLESGASTQVRASVRKFLDWCETPRWHEARDVTPVEWGRGFPDKGWVNQEALELLTRNDVR